MSPRGTAFVIATAFASAAIGQQAQTDRELHFTSTGTRQAVEEIATDIRSITDIKQTSFDTKENALVLHGAASQVALAEWIFPLLDLPTSDLVATQQRLKTTKHEYLVEPDDVVRVFYLSNMATVQNFQEVVTAVRSVLRIRRMFTYNPLRAIVVRGTEDEAAAAEFVLNEMDKPAISDSRSAIPHTLSPEFRMRSTEDNIIRVFYLPNTDENKASIREVLRSQGEPNPRWRWRCIGIVSVIAAIIILLAIAFPR